MQGPKNFAAELGGDASENGNFQAGKQRFQATIFSRSFHFIFLMKNRGDDATENVNFQRGKQRLQGRKNFKLNFDELKHLTIEILI